MRESELGEEEGMDLELSGRKRKKSPGRKKAKKEEKMPAKPRTTWIWVTRMAITVAVEIRRKEARMEEKWEKGEEGKRREKIDFLQTKQIRGEEKRSETHKMILV